MASHMVCAPSRDTLFIRGFSGRRDIQDIREYFERQAGCECTVEFFKQDEINNVLYVALKFETRDIAKNILDRYDDTDVMGDHIDMSWFKDLRKAKQQAALERQQRYGNMGYRNYGYNRNNHFHNQRRMSPIRGRYQRSRDRSYSRSASRSRSRSRSPSRGRNRDKRNNRAASSSSRSSSPEQSKAPSKVRSKVQPSDKHSEGDQDLDRSASSPSKKTAIEDAKPPNSPDERDRSPGRQSNRSQDIKPSPKNKRDQSEERKVTRMSVEDQRVQKREEDRFSRMSDDSMTRSQQGETRMSRIDDAKSRNANDDMKFDDGLSSRMMDEKPLGRQAILEQRMRKTHELDREEMNRFGKSSSMRNDSMLDAQDVGERRRGMRASAFSPTMQLEAQERDRFSGMKGDDMGLRGRGFDGPSSTMFWDDLDDQRKSKGFQSKERITDGMRGDRGMRAMMDDDDILPRDRGMTAMRGIDDDDRFGYGNDMRRGPNQRQSRDLDFSQDAMVLVQDKKKEIERVYKNDCETFVTVVKMLISKEPSLEEKLQYSLRENLKEIGQRCILDLREYMDRLREHDNMPMK